MLPVATTAWWLLFCFWEVLEMWPCKLLEKYCKRGKNFIYNIPAWIWCYLGHEILFVPPPSSYVTGNQLVLFELHLHCQLCCFEQHSHFHSSLHQHWYMIWGCVYLGELKNQNNYLALFGMHVLSFVLHQHLYLRLWMHFFSWWIDK